MQRLADLRQLESTARSRSIHSGSVLKYHGALAQNGPRKLAHVSSRQPLK
jgi:hypothetical protein